MNYILSSFSVPICSPVDNDNVAVMLYDFREDLFILKLMFYSCIRSPCLYAEHISKYIEDNN